MIDTNYFKPKDFAKMLNVSTKTLQRWDLDGLLVAYRTPTNRRYYTYDQYLQFKGITSDDTRKIVIYSRVSSHGQSDELKNQVEFLKTFCNARGFIVDDVITDIGSTVSVVLVVGSAVIISNQIITSLLDKNSGVHKCSNFR